MSPALHLNSSPPPEAMVLLRILDNFVNTLLEAFVDEESFTWLLRLFKVDGTYANQFEFVEGR